MDEKEKGKLIIAVAKTLKSFQLGDHRIAALLYASSHAGRAGLLASALRSDGAVGSDRLTTLAACEGFSAIELHSHVIPWLEREGLCFVRRTSGTIQTIESVALGYDSILKAVARNYAHLNGTAEDLACVQLLGLASAMPIPESEALHALAKDVGEEKARTALSLAKGYKIVSHKSGRGLREPIIYSEKLWAKAIDKASGALVSLKADGRAVLLELIEKVRKYQGMPESLLRKDARQAGAEQLVDIGMRVGLLQRTELQMSDGSVRGFLTTPHFYEDVASEHGEDVCDRVKIFLDSIRNGQHYGSTGTGRILDAEVLLRRLLNSGSIGPCTAIGTDYVTSEKAGIIVVQRGQRPRDCVMRLAQKDTVAKVLDVITTGRIEGVGREEMKSSDMRDGTHFRSVEEQRARSGDVPEAVADAERAIILKLREG